MKKTVSILFRTPGKLSATVLMLFVPLLASAWPSMPDVFRYPLRFDLRVLTNVSYGQTSEEVADLAIPHRANPVPALVLIHGGGWSLGDKDDFAFMASSFTDNGIAVMNINYRLAKWENPSTQWPAQLQDVQLAVRWLRSHARELHIDPSRVCAMGGSAGGHLAMFLGYEKSTVRGDRSHLLAEQSSSVSCVINWFGPANLMHERFVKLGEKLPVLHGRTVEEDSDLWRSASPLFLISPSVAPTLVAQPRSDRVVAVELAEELVNKLMEEKVEVEYLLVDGDHGFEQTPSAQKQQVKEQSVAFVMKHLQMSAGKAHEVRSKALQKNVDSSKHQ